MRKAPRRKSGLIDFYTRGQTPYPSHPTSTSSAWPKASLPSRIGFPPSPPPPPPPLTCLRGTWKASPWV
ncbi:hypothetical protein Naga_101809g1 [Nannochloropsis gaditana]|uniref:Uncharacterized protein n=1 Tax=Nannochloropsis gaditana TaxID=72520 RepID=W7THC2_9STRA|nr:hypothetical protein Naga_101809g1 [Nannochloropsis gaditana]